MAFSWSGLRFICVCMTAIVSVTFIGYQALLPILEDEGLFQSLCSNDEKKCDAQSLRLDVMYNVSVFSSYIAYLFFAIIILKYGPRASIVIGGIVETIGCIIFSFSIDWASFCGYIIIAVGSSGIILGLIGIPSQFNIKYQGVLYSLLIGCIDASSGITYIFLIMYKYKNISLQTLYIILSFGIILMTVLSYFFVFSTYFTRTTTRYNTIDVELNSPQTRKRIIPPPSVSNSNTSNNENNVPLITDDDPINLFTSISSEEMVGFYNIHFNSTWQDTFWSMQFVSILVWSMFYMTSIYFYITTLDRHLKWVTNNDEEEILFGQQIFSIMLLSSGLCTIVTGPIIDAFGMKFALCVMAFLSLITSISQTLKIYNLEISLTMIGNILNRFFYFTMAPLIINNVFGAARQNFIYGLVLFISACFNLIGILFDYTSQKAFNGNYSIITLIVGISCCLSAMFLCWNFRNNPLIT